MSSDAEAALDRDDVVATGVAVLLLTIVSSGVGMDASRTVVTAVGASTPVDAADVENVVVVTRDLDACEVLEAPVVASRLLTALPSVVPDTEPDDDAPGDAALLLELDADVDADATDADDPEDEEPEPVEVVSEASFAKPTAAGEYR